MVDWSGIWIPLVTPLRDGELDLAALVRLVRHLATRGVAGFVVCGSTGEAAMLDETEQTAVLAATIEAAGELPVLMGLSGVRPAQLAGRGRRLALAHSLAGFLVSAPAYVKPSQAGIADFFRTLADASLRPLIVYDIPARTGVRIQVDTLLALAEHPNIVALKDCSGDRAAAQAVLDDGRLALLAGNDDELFDQLARGAAGGITASAHLATARFVDLHRQLNQGRLPEARRLWRGLAPLARELFSEPNPAPLKAALACAGWLHGELRAPLCVASATATQRVMARLEDLNRL